MGRYDLVMEERELQIGRWHVEFYFAQDEYDIDTLIDRLFDFGASAKLMKQALELMSSGRMNTGFTFTNEEEYVALIAIGPTEDGKEFINTLVHEVHHLAVAIAENLGLELEGEGPAYLSGDSAMALADLICRMGCTCCR